MTFVDERRCKVTAHRNTGGNACDKSLVVYRLVHPPVTRESGVRLPARETLFVFHSSHRDVIPPASNHISYFYYPTYPVHIPRRAYRTCTSIKRDSVGSSGNLLVKRLHTGCASAIPCFPPSFRVATRPVGSFRKFHHPLAFPPASYPGQETPGGLLISCRLGVKVSCSQYVPIVPFVTVHSFSTDRMLGSTLFLADRLTDVHCSLSEVSLSFVY